MKTLVTKDAQIVNRVDLGRHELNGHSTAGRKFKLTLHAPNPNRFAKGVGGKFGLVETVDDPDHNLVILDRRVADKFYLGKAVCRIMLQW